MSNPESDFLDASHVLGRAIAALPPAEKEIVAKLYDEVRDFAAQQEVKGIHLDKAAFFAAGIICHPEVNNDDLIQAAANLIEKEWLFTKANQAQESSSAQESQPPA